MSEVTLKFKKTNANAKLPTKNNESDTGFDVYCVEDKHIPARGSAVVDVGLEFAFISPGYWVKIEGRSGLGFRYGISPHPGIIDSGYRGNIIGVFDNISDSNSNIEIYSRLLQICAPNLGPIIVEIVDNLEDLSEQTTRGSGGFGSTGK
jgi:dUTP pyrophosphatase